MKLYEKIAFKLGTKVGTALYGGNLTPEQKRQLERKVYQEKLEEERMKAAASRSSGGSSGSSCAQVCANCHYFGYLGTIDCDYYCTKHDIEFSYIDIRDDVHYRRRCSDYTKKGYW